jgi:hypothetical protein
MVDQSLRLADHVSASPKEDPTSVKALDLAISESMPLCAEEII